MRVSSRLAAKAKTPRPARAFAVLLGGAMLASTAYLLVLSITPLLSRRYLPDSPWIGLPNAALILGVAAGTPLLTWLFARRGRPFSLGLGLSVAACAAVGLALSAWWEAGFVVHFGVSLMLGCGYAAYHLTRYTAALLVPASRSGRAIGLVVWVAVAGAFVAPLIFGWIERIVAPRGGEAFSLAYLCAAALYAFSRRLVPAQPVAPCAACAGDPPLRTEERRFPSAIRIVRFREDFPARRRLAGCGAGGDDGPHDDGSASDDGKRGFPCRARSDDGRP